MRQHHSLIGTPNADELGQFGRYSLVAKLASGGMAEVFLARLRGDAGFEKLVCIKRIRPELLRDRRVVSLFVAEAKTAALISHPNVCRVFQLGAVDHQYFIAMEYLDGVSLAHVCSRERYPAPSNLRFCVGMIVQAAEGLHHAHELEQGGTPIELVHRDIKPQNLFVTSDGTVKVLDFGIAKMRDHADRTTIGGVKGTYAYMAPEQLRGDVLDRRSDVFSMGVVAWEVLAQRSLFRRENDYYTTRAIMHDEIPNVCSHRRDVPPEVGAVIMRALARDREQRWPSARAFGDALAQAVHPSGGPLAPSAIAKEVTRVFGPQLSQHRAMLERARAFDELERERETARQMSFEIRPFRRADGDETTEVTIDAFAVGPTSLRRRVIISLLALAVSVGIALAYIVPTGSRVAPASPAPETKVVMNVSRSPTTAAHAPGILAIDSSPPAANIWIDGKRYGKTPLQNVVLVAGKHNIRAVSRSGAVRTMTLTIEPGEKARHLIVWSPAKGRERP